GEVVDKLPPCDRAHFGLRRSFQTAELVRELTNRENVLIGLYSRVPGIVRRAPFWPMLPSGRRDMRWMQDRADEVLGSVGAAIWTSQLSRDAPHGVEQLTQLASVCVAAPDIVILDEPATGLSPSE